jgi:hypothetical protein
MHLHDVEESPEVKCVLLRMDELLRPWRIRGGNPTTCSSGSATAHPTSFGMRSGWVAHTTAKKWLRSSLLIDAGVGLKHRQDDPMITYMISSDHRCSGRLSTVIRTL